MMKLRIVADDKIPFLRGALEPFAEVTYLPGGAIAPADVKNADALITRTRTRCGEALLAGSRVRFIATATIGYDHIDTAYLHRAGIAWRNAPGCNAASVAQYIGSALVSSGVELCGKTLGVIGVGNVGSKVAALGEALGMRVLRNDPPRAEREGSTGFTELPELLAEADFVTIHTPLTRDGAHPTFHLCDAGFPELMRSGAQLFNSGRGEVVDTAALKAALKSGRISAAVLDVWENEPGIDRELLDLVRIGTPHIAGYSTDGKANGTAMAVQAVAAFFGIPGLAEWRPERLPEPETPEIELETGASVREQVAQALLHTYDIGLDDGKLRSDPAGFEPQRGHYRIRREYPAFRVRGGRPETAAVLKTLGFTLLPQGSACGG